MDENDIPVPAIILGHLGGIPAYKPHLSMELIEIDGNIMRVYLSITHELGERDMWERLIGRLGYGILALGERRFIFHVDIEINELLPPGWQDELYKFIGAFEEVSVAEFWRNARADRVAEDNVEVLAIQGRIDYLKEEIARLEAKKKEVFFLARNRYIDDHPVSAQLYSSEAIQAYRTQLGDWVFDEMVRQIALARNVLYSKHLATLEGRNQ